MCLDGRWGNLSVRHRAIDEGVGDTPWMWRVAELQAERYCAVGMTVPNHFN